MESVGSLKGLCVGHATEKVVGGHIQSVREPPQVVKGRLACSGLEVRDSGWSCPSSVDTYPLGEEEESTMPKSRPPYPAAFRQQMVELVRSGRTPGELAREFEPSAEAIRNWAAQADRDAGKRSDGLRTEEHEEIRRLRRENRQLREEREILAKATAWFARETGPGRSTGS